MFSGSFVALVTPFHGGRVDVEKLEELVEHQIEAGIHGLVPCGTTGESATLSHEEHELVISTVVRRADGRIPVLAGTGSNSTSEAIRLTRFAQDAGADGALLITPYYNKPTQQGLKAHFEAVARETDIPLVLYNIPSRTGVNMLPSTVIELARLPGVVGIKEASGSVDQTVEILRESDITVLSGDDSLTLPLMAVGARGVISVAANVVPSLVVDLVDLAAAGDFAAARELHSRLFPLFKILFVETNPIPVKAALAIQGRISPEVRLPLTELSECHQKKLADVIESLEK
ncbi:MAG: 4-hydroxy-tetrahydrodipicolinate synthase [Planctomycetes bacterium]|nr:4-hydroxy-tetrahydrodipicolinate synthase [Planctomycetota bacterium]